VEDAVEQKLAPFTELLTQLTRKVEQLSLRDGGMDDNNGPRQVAEAGPSATGRYAGFGRCYALLRMRPLSNSWAECSVVISCGKVDYDKSG
jgi:hypothetical protein